MSLDYETPRYPIRLAASAAGFEVNTLRSLYQRGHFRIIGGEEAKARGLGHALNLQDTLHVAVAKRLIDMGAHPRAAFNGALDFAHIGTPERLPAQLFADGFTALIFFASTEHANVVQVRDSLAWGDVFWNARTGRRENGMPVLLNDVERDVFAGLRLNFRPDTGWTDA